MLSRMRARLPGVPAVGGFPGTGPGPRCYNIAMITRLLPTRLPALAVQALRYGLIGVLNTGVAYAIFLVGLAVSFPPQVALVAGTVVGAGNSFLLNRFWTFRDHGSSWEAQLPRFLGVATGVWLLNAGLLELLLRGGWSPALAQLVCLVVTTVVGFIAHRQVSFSGGEPRGVR